MTPNKTNQALVNDFNVIFDLTWYEQQARKHWSDKRDAIKHYLDKGWRENFDPHPLFSGTFYLQSNHDVKAAGIAPLLHFLQHGHKENRDPNPLFSVAWYKNQYPEANSHTINPLIHYISKGSKLGYRPNPDFDPAWYSNTYQKIIKADIEPLAHFITQGASAGLARNVDEEFKLVQAKKSTLMTKKEKSAAATKEKPKDLKEQKSSFPVNKKQLENVKLLSFDIWDTVLRRDCYPDEIKLQSARYLLLTRYWLIRPGYRSMSALYKRRLQVENQSAPKGDFEYRFSVALTRWIEDILEPGISNEIVHSIQDEILDHEFKAESRSVRLDPEFKKFVEGNTLPPTIFLSDFYMESAFITRLMESQGIGNLFVRGYSSCDTYQNKRSGELFKVAVEHFSVKPDEILHVGDNLTADIEVPRSLGIRCAHYEQPEEIRRREERKRIFESYLQGSAREHHEDLQGKLAQLTSLGTKKSLNSELEQAGIRLAPIAVSFVLHVIETALRFNAKNIYFFTREGQFLKHLCERLIELDPYNIQEYPTPRLLEVSRVATFSASLRSAETPELMRLWNQYSKQSLRAFCSSLNISVDLFKAAAKRNAIDLDEVVDMPWDDQRFMETLKDKSVAKALNLHIEKNRNLFSDYLKQEELLDGNQAEVIVDIGWRGTIQDNLCYVADKHIHGCYLGLYKFINNQPNNSSKDGWLFDHNRYEYGLDSEEIAPLEMIFNGLGGSVIGYEKVGSQVKPKRHVIEGEEAVVEKYVSHIQTGLLKGAEVVANYVRLHGLTSEDLRELARDNARNLLEFPSSSIAKAFFELEHNEMFGTGEATDMSLAGGLAKACEGLHGHRLHYAASQFLKSSHWKAGLLALDSVKTFYHTLNPHEQNNLPIAFTRHYKKPVVGREGGPPKAAIYVPAPIVGSGGHRTIFNIARRIHALGAELFIYLESEGAGIGCVEGYLQGTPAHIINGWDRSAPMDFVLATIAHSAAYVAEHTCPHKGYLIQDFEAGFNPLSDGYVIAENSYCHGLNNFTIGNWLTHVLNTQYGISATPAGLGIDTEIYRPLPGIVRENAICFLYQPDKPRRTPLLGINALRRVKQAMPDVKIFVYGSDLPIHLDFEVENMGLIHDLYTINWLYNRCKVGLCISMSNPSRIPFEMMAAGTTPVDLYRYNNLMDHESGTAVLAYQSDASLAEAMIALLKNEKVCAARSNACIESVRSKTLLWEQDLLANNVYQLISNEPIPIQQVTSIYNDSPLVATSDNNVASVSYCDWQKTLSRLSRG